MRSTTGGAPSGRPLGRLAKRGWPSSAMSALLVVVLLCSVIAGASNLVDLEHVVTYSQAMDEAQQSVVRAFDGLMDSDQGVHRYAYAPSTPSRTHYLSGARRFKAELDSVASFVRTHRLNGAGRAVAGAQAAFRQIQDRVAGPMLGSAGPDALLTTLPRIDRLADEVQTDLLNVHRELAVAKAQAHALTHTRMLTSITLVTFFLLLLAAIGLAVDRKRRRDEARSGALLEQRAAALERSNAALQDFAHVASHDLQEPLRMVSSYTQLLARRYKGKLDADADVFIGFAVDGAKRMQVLIENILSYSRIASGEHANRAIDAGAACREALGNLEAPIAESGARINAAALPRVIGDPGQLTQLFQNLIGNALKYRSSDAPVIDITASRDESLWTFSVSDNGIGIAAEYRERVFRMFQRLHAKSEYSGTGIGLAICRRIVERHGGTIWVDSPLGTGTTFNFTLRAA